MAGSPMRRVMGTEVEYGISVPGDPGANAMVTSSQIVNAYAAQAGTGNGTPRWDYEEESPLRDARGFDYGPGTPPGSSGSTFGSEDELGLANHILTNGARLYVDHAHPEYSSPEVTNALDVVRWDKAGERIMAEAARRVGATPGLAPIRLYKNNTDNKGASYGAHENYLMPRSTPFADIVTHLIPFFVSRQVVCGAGRVGIGQDGRGTGFQISSRADFFEVEVGLETTLKRPIVNTRDEPHADAEKHRRLHVIIGDANLAELSTFLKVGTTSLVLSMIEDDVLTGDLAVQSPVAALRAVSHDPSLRYRIDLRSGRSLTAVELQLEYLDQARKYVEDRYGSDVDGVTSLVLQKWEWVLSRLESDPMSLASDLDWPAKLRLLQGYRDRDGLSWDAPRLALIDLQYSDVRPDKGLYNKLVARGSMNTMVTEPQVSSAVTDPPEDTRAYFRGQCVARYSAQLAAASWDSVVFDLGRRSLVRVPTLDPERGTRAHVAELLERSPDAESLVDTLTGGR